MALSISKYQRAWINPTFQSSEASEEDRWNDIGPISETSLSKKNLNQRHHWTSVLIQRYLRDKSCSVISSSSTQ